MEKETKTALEKGEVFSTDYVHQLREEAKTHRLKAEDLEKKVVAGGTDVTQARINAAIELEKKDAKKNLALLEIKHLCEAAGVKIDPTQIHQDGVEPEKSFNVYVEKNPTIFKKEALKIAGVDLGAGESVTILTGGTMEETRKNPGARSLMSRVYSNLVNEDKQRNRRRE